jgi:hypothetical protein
MIFLGSFMRLRLFILATIFFSLLFLDFFPHTHYPLPWFHTCLFLVWSIQHYTFFHSVPLISRRVRFFSSLRSRLIYLLVLIRLLGYTYYLHLLSITVTLAPLPSHVMSCSHSVSISQCFHAYCTYDRDTVPRKQMQYKALSRLVYRANVV